MNLWLPKLSTVRKIECSTADFFREGNKYNVYTPEGIVMKSQIRQIDSEAMCVRINAHFLALKSQLFCGVTPINGTSCKITREQSYPGMIGTLFTRMYDKREANETNEYLRAWEAYAKGLLLKTE